MLGRRGGRTGGGPPRTSSRMCRRGLLRSKTRAFPRRTASKTGGVQTAAAAAMPDTAGGPGLAGAYPINAPCAGLCPRLGAAYPRGVQRSEAHAERSAKRGAEPPSWIKGGGPAVGTAGPRGGKRRGSGKLGAKRDAPGLDQPEAGGRPWQPSSCCSSRLLLHTGPYEASVMPSQAWRTELRRHKALTL